MKERVVMFAVVPAVVGMLAGCFTSVTAHTETKKNADGTTTRAARARVVGMGKASQVAAEGLYAEETPTALSAGVRSASATQKSDGKGVGR
jgi:hypothetical protein